MPLLVQSATGTQFALLSHCVGWHYQYVEQPSGVGVLDKAVAVLSAIAEEPLSLAELTARTGLPRATAHRLACALEVHQLLARDPAGRWEVGPELVRLASGGGTDRLLDGAAPVLTALRDHTGESAQLYVRRGEHRVCVAAAERERGLRDTVPVGSVLPLTAGSAAQVLLAEEPVDQLATLLATAAFSARTLADVRRRGWAHSIAEREPGVASVSAPVRAGSGRIVAAISVSGPADRLGRRPGSGLAPAVVSAAAELTAALSPD